MRFVLVVCEKHCFAYKNASVNSFTLVRIYSLPSKFLTELHSYICRVAKLPKPFPVTLLDIEFFVCKRCPSYITNSTGV